MAGAFDVLERARERFFFSADDVAGLAARFKRDHPETASAVVAWADSLLDHEFDLLGSGPRRLGSQINWCADLATGRSWPRVPSALLPVQANDGRTDIKRVWDLSRCQHFAVLGQAYALTGHERYAREWVAQMLDWDARNPVHMGPNWMVAMEAAIRIVNWIWGLAFMGGSEAFSPKARTVFLRSVLAHGRFIARHVEPYGNHRFSDLVGLAFVGAMFPEFAEANGWLATAIDGLARECEQQVRADGSHFEGSIPYHRLVFEMAASCVLLLRRNGVKTPPEVDDAVARMARFVAGYLKPSGWAPQIGDADDGRLQALTPLDKRDHSYLLSLAAAATGDPAFKTARAPHPESFWVMGADGLATFDRLETLHERPVSQAFPDAGVYVLRAERLTCVVSCRRPARSDVGAHSHNDHLSFGLCVDGRDLVVDPGTFVYTADRAARNAFRGTGAHGTVMLDGREINHFDTSDPFRLADICNCSVSGWEQDDASVVLRASHDGYARLAGAPRVDRTFSLDRRASVLRVADRVTGGGEHEIAWRFLCAPGVTVRREADGVVLSAGPIEVALSGGPGPLDVAPAWVSPRYGLRVRTNALVAIVSAPLPLEAAWVWRIRPARGRN